eukprot:2674665-Pyramimonas_sp.AAC.1
MVGLGWEMPEFYRLRGGRENCRELLFTSPAPLRIHLRAAAPRGLERHLAQKCHFGRDRLCYDAIVSHLASSKFTPLQK